jgi:hypothetical protein
MSTQSSDRPGIATPSENPFRQGFATPPIVAASSSSALAAIAGSDIAAIRAGQKPDGNNCAPPTIGIGALPRAGSITATARKLFRRRKAPASSPAVEKTVTDQSTKAPLTSGKISSPPISVPTAPLWRRFLSDFGQIVCRFCGRVGRFLNPFHSSD